MVRNRKKKTCKVLITSKIYLNSTLVGEVVIADELSDRSKCILFYARKSHQ